jgi:hypothetical protein
VQSDRFLRVSDRGLPEYGGDDECEVLPQHGVQQNQLERIRNLYTLGYLQGSDF